jgi:hypothetical protein
MRKNTVYEIRILGESKTHLPDKEIWIFGNPKL